MKKVRTVLVIALMSSAMVVAQHKNGKRSPKAQYLQELTTEQLATLKTKKMTLALDLSAKQQEAIFEFNKSEAEFRKAKIAGRKSQKETGERTRPTADERFAMENARLDHRIAQQQELKKILNDEQFDQWKKMQLYKHARGKKSRQKEGRRG